MTDKVKNIFNISGIAEGDSFIGKKNEIDFFREKYLNDDSKAAYSIVGLPKTGKTSFAKIVFKDVDDDTLIISCNLKMYEKFEGMWQIICERINSYLKKNKIENEMLNAILIKLINTDYKDKWDIFVGNLKLAFEEISRLNIKIIFIFDQFDYAKKLFDTIQKFQLVRTILSEYNNISSLIISRSPIYEIEGKDIQASSFFGVVEPRYFNTFDDDDIKEFHKILFKSGINLSDVQIKEMEFYTGRIPYLYALMGHYIIEDYNNNREIDIKSIFLRNKEKFNYYYEECIKHLREADYLRKVLPFSIGPKIGVKKSDVDELYNIGYLRECNDDERYITISKYFMTFLSIDMLEDISLWDNIISTEKRLKYIVKRELTRLVRKFQIYGEDESNVIKEIMIKCNIPESSITGKYARFIDNNINIYGRISNYLDVMSLGDVIKIISYCWLDIFNEYFNNEAYNDWKPAFDLCVRARNPFAHGHDDYLETNETNLVNQYCIKILDMLSEEKILSIVVDDNYLEAARAFANNQISTDNRDIENEDDMVVNVNNSYRSEYHLADERYLNQETDFYIDFKDSGRPIIRGYVVFNNERYSAIVPRNHCTPDLLEMNLGESFRVIPKEINHNKYQVESVINE